ncbi:hypothetical protein BZM26_10050 [Paraburkholderia strydomiana]|nr:hypothetical protein BZM26_10050 [Paraburkholderia strydomiana]
MRSRFNARQDVFQPLNAGAIGPICIYLGERGYPVLPVGGRERPSADMRQDHFKVLQFVFQLVVMHF